MKIEGPRVDPEDIATRKGIVVQPKPDSIDGVSGMLVKAGDQFGIMYATNIPSKGFQKFCIAHELGHYCIDGHSDALLSNGAHYSQAGFRSSDPFEQEADYFAAALLMPELTFRKEMNRHDPGLTCVEELRKACETSLTATAIRYSGLTRDGVAVILSTGATIEWCFMSEGLKEAKGVLIRQVVAGQPADQGGIRANDVVVSVDGTAVEGPRDLQRIISSTPVGQSVKISLMREGKEQQVAVTVGAYQTAPRVPRRLVPPAPGPRQPSPQPPR